MRSLKKTLIVLEIITISILMNFVYVKPINAQEPLHIKLEVSKDGNHWYNYSGSEDPDGETLAANPGDEIIIRLKVWNSGEAEVGATVGGGVIHNGSYIASVKDVDIGNFIGDYFEGTGIATIESVPAAGSENNNYEPMTARLVLSNDFPAGETIISGIAGVSELQPGGQPENQENSPIENESPLSYLKKLISPDIAYANGFIEDSTVRISVNGGLPDTGADLK